MLFSRLPPPLDECGVNLRHGLHENFPKLFPPADITLSHDLCFARNHGFKRSERLKPAVLNELTFIVWKVSSHYHAAIVSQQTRLCVRIGKRLNRVLYLGIGCLLEAVQRLFYRPEYGVELVCFHARYTSKSGGFRP